VLDLGKQQAGSVAEHQFLIENTGRKPLKISHISRDCGCLTAPVGETVVEPGFAAQLPVKIRFDDKPSDEVQRRLVVHSNDPVNPKLVLTVTAQVVGAESK
jgi:hypothetical protein